MKYIHRIVGNSFVAVSTLLFALSTIAWALPAEDSAKDDSEIAKRLKASANVLQEIMSARLTRVPQRKS